TGVGGHEIGEDAGCGRVGGVAGDHGDRQAGQGERSAAVRGGGQRGDPVLEAEALGGRVEVTEGPGAGDDVWRLTLGELVLDGVVGRVSRVHVPDVPQAREVLEAGGQLGGIELRVLQVPVGIEPPAE